MPGIRWSVTMTATDGLRARRALPVHSWREHLEDVLEVAAECPDAVGLVVDDQDGMGGGPHSRRRELTMKHIVKPSARVFGQTPLYGRSATMVAPSAVPRALSCIFRAVRILTVWVLLGVATPDAVTHASCNVIPSAIQPFRSTARLGRSSFRPVRGIGGSSAPTVVFNATASAIQRPRRLGRLHRPAPAWCRLFCSPRTTARPWGPGSLASYQAALPSVRQLLPARLDDRRRARSREPAAHATGLRLRFPDALWVTAPLTASIVAAVVCRSLRVCG